MRVIRYLAVQVFAYGLDMGGFLLAYNLVGLHPIAANILGKIVAGVFAFAAHRSFTYRHSFDMGPGYQAGMYFLLLGLNLPLSSAVMTAISFFVSPYVVAKFLSDVICVFVTYWLNTTFVFSGRDKRLVPFTAPRGDKA